ncbi:MAG: hypothetical protein QW279_09585 [Candidatus Jordarchaeaceae archaeon]
MIVRVKTWDEFKQLIREHNPKSLCYNIQREATSRHLTSLRLILPVVEKQYVFIDNAHGNRLRKTGLRLHIDKSGTIYLRDEDVAEFVKTELGRKDLQIHPYWTV